MSVSNNPAITLSTYALGSCIAVVAYDPGSRTGGILHLMLPDSKLLPNKALEQPAMFADTGIPLLFRSLVGLKSDPARTSVLIVGGASVLCANDTFRIGERNILATEEHLARAGYRITRSAVGGSINRTVHLEIGTGNITLKTPVANDTWLLAA